MSRSTTPTFRKLRHRGPAAVLACVAAVATVAACGGSDAGGGGGGDKVAVSLITKDSTNPFFVAMKKGAEAEAKKDGVDLSVGSGKEDGDEQGQVQLIENAIAAGQKGILITPNGPGVNSAIKKARDAGLYVIALDTPPDPADTVDITFATDNFKAGELIGQWTKAQLAGKPATIAMLDLFNDKVVSVDYNRDQGFLTGMGIDTKDKQKNGDEDKTGKYDGGDYTIVCNEPTQGAEDGGRTAMENCLTKNPDINVVYTINEPAATGADNALKAAGKTGALIVSVDGGCDGVKEVTDGVIGATAQQYPLKMAELGVKAIADYAKNGTKPSTSPGLDFYDTGVALVTDKPVDGVESITSADGSKICWG
ncbi:substrate-binding domain-containing protein [Kineococcus sp. DHX-1]|uniref:substrate-binding domain-containing protein n=1 Tax=Kineococcus sp. DHX-1 TaxID=3349638 RepID=UPI0036D2117D